MAFWARKVVRSFEKRTQGLLDNKQLRLSYKDSRCLMFIMQTNVKTDASQIGRVLFVAHTLVELQNLEKNLSIPNLTSQTSLQYKKIKNSQSSVVGQNNEKLVSKDTDVPLRCSRW